MLSPGREDRGGEVTLGARPSFSQFYPLPGTNPGDRLHQAVHCGAIVFAYLPQFPYSTGFSLSCPQTSAESALQTLYLFVLCSR